MACGYGKKIMNEVFKRLVYDRFDRISFAPFLPLKISSND